MKQTDYEFNGIHPIVLRTHVFTRLCFISICYNTYTLWTVNTSTQKVVPWIKKKITLLAWTTKKCNFSCYAVSYDMLHAIFG